jgi:hypothetical protein
MVMAFTTENTDYTEKKNSVGSVCSVVKLW